MTFITIPITILKTRLKCEQILFFTVNFFKKKAALNGSKCYLLARPSSSSEKTFNLLIL